MHVITAVQDLKYHILDVSVLYNQYAVKYGMWEHCLSIMHSCHSNEPDVIARHWKRIILAMVPLHSHNPSVTNWLRKQAEECGAQKLADGLFEDINWSNNLEHKVRALGRKFYNSGADYIFPLGLIARLLEELWMHYNQQAVRSTLSKAQWIIKLFLDINVSYFHLFETYTRLYHEKADPTWQLQMCQSMCYIVEMWKGSAIAFKVSPINIRVNFAESCPAIIRVFEEVTTDIQAMLLENEVQAIQKNCLEQLTELKSELLNFRVQHFS